MTPNVTHSCKPDAQRPHRRGLSRRSLLIGGLAAAGCAGAPSKPPLCALYGGGSQSPMQPPLIVIPGVFGSRLRHPDGGRELWPGSSLDLLFGEYAGLGLAIDPDTLERIPDGLVPYAVFEDGLGKDFYGTGLRTLERAGGYRRRVPGDRVEAGERNYYVYLYD